MIQIVSLIKKLKNLRKVQQFSFFTCTLFNVDNFINIVYTSLKFPMVIIDMIREGTVSRIVSLVLTSCDIKKYVNK